MWDGLGQEPTEMFCLWNCCNFLSVLLLLPVGLLSVLHTTPICSCWFCSIWAFFFSHEPEVLCFDRMVVLSPCVPQISVRMTGVWACLMSSVSLVDSALRAPGGPCPVPTHVPLEQGDVAVPWVPFRLCRFFTTELLRAGGWQWAHVVLFMLEPVSKQCSEGFCGTTSEKQRSRLFLVMSQCDYL